MNDNQIIVTALKLGLDFVERSERLAIANAKSIYFILIKFDMRLQSWQELKPIVREYRQALKTLKFQDKEMVEALDYLDNIYASLAQSAHHNEKLPISFCLLNQPTDLVKFAKDMAVHQRKLQSLIHVFN